MYTLAQSNTSHDPCLVIRGQRHLDPSRVRGGLTPVRNAGNDFRKGTTMTRNFVDRDKFEEVIRATPRADGGAYKDIATIYGDMSRLVVGWLANTDQRKLAELYNDFGWGGSANVRAIQAAARRWMDEYGPQNSPSGLDTE